jgi:hypothetical protein
MDKKFLNKVVDQIVSETKIEHKKVSFPFPFSFSLPFFSPLPPLPLSDFIHHCKEVYGLNRDETNYVYKEYVIGINNKIR